MDSVTEETAESCTLAGTRTRRPKSLEQHGLFVKGGFAFIGLSRVCALRWRRLKGSTLLLRDGVHPSVVMDFYDS